ncbi:hypothetical protein [Paractinoplanes maris]|uniref:hypothetical protein n=1 Tax=Paractinoplanes maris TaxID=1734446 RepID=UPI00202286A7|nr:hypothetical protein [Actinoplanes maris]
MTFQPADPEYGLDQFMRLDAFGGWVPGGIGGNPMLTATFLEYVRRGGETDVDVPVWREYVASEGDPAWLVQVMTVAAELEAMTDGGACVECFAEYLSTMLARNWSTEEREDWSHEGAP